MKLVRGVINHIETITDKLGFSTAKITTNNEQNFDDVKRYQQYGFQSNPLPIKDDDGCEVIISDINQQRSVIAENDPRYRPSNEEEGSVQLYTNQDKHSATLNPIKRAINFLSGRTLYSQDDSGLIKLTNHIAELEMSIYGIQQSIGDSSRTIKHSSIADAVGESQVYIQENSYSVSSNKGTLAFKSKVDVIAPNINLHGKTTATNLIMEGGVIDGDVTIIPTGQNTLQSEPITFEDAMEEIAVANNTTTDITHLETAIKSDSDGTVDIDGTTYDTYAKSVADRKTTTFRQATAPIIDSDSVEGDTWLNADNAMFLLSLVGGALAWLPAQDSDIATAQATADLAYALADNKIVTFFQAAQPTGETGDLWIRTTDGKMFRYNGTSWSFINDTRITTALTDAGAALSASSTAQDTADSKIVSFFQDNQPTVGESSVGDLWVDTNDGNNLWRFNGSAWIDIADSGISTAISDAASAQSTGNFALSTANNALSTANTSYSLGSSIDSRTFGISYDSSGTVFAEKVNANVGFIANGIHGNNTTARFNTTGSANYGVTSQGTISGGIFTSTGSSSSAVGVQGVSNTPLGKGIQGTSTSGIGGELISSTGIGAKITNNTSTQSKPACQITNGNGSGIALSVSGKSKLGNTDVTGNLVVNTGTITATYKTNSNAKVTNLNADYLDGWSHSSFPKTVTSSLAGSFSSANWPNIKYVRMNVGGIVRKVMVYDG